MKTIVKILIGIVGFIVVMNLMSIVFSGTDSTNELDKNIENTNQYDDEEYLTCVAEYLYTIQICNNKIIEYSNNADFENVAISGFGLQKHSSRALDDLDQFDISPELQTFDAEFREALKDTYQRGKYLESGAKNINIDDLETSLDYTYRAINHMERANIALEYYFG